MYKIWTEDTHLSFSVFSHSDIQLFSDLSSTNQCHRTQRFQPLTISNYLQPQQQYWAPTVHPGNSHVQAQGAAGTVGMDCHQCPPGMVEASGAEQSVSAHPEHGGLSLGWAVGSLCERTAHWVAATHKRDQACCKWTSHVKRNKECYYILN
jgi:hypothetical protein